MRLFNPKVRTGQGSTRLSNEEFQRRRKERFYDPAFDPERDKIDRLAEIAWDAYDDHRKARGLGRPALSLPIRSCELVCHKNDAAPHVAHRATATFVRLAP